MTDDDVIFGPGLEVSTSGEDVVLTIVAEAGALSIRLPPHEVREYCSLLTSIVGDPSR